MTLLDCCCCCFGIFCPLPFLPFLCISPSAIISAIVEPVIGWFVGMLLPNVMGGMLGGCPCCSFMGEAAWQSQPPAHGPYY